MLLAILMTLLSLSGVGPAFGIRESRTATLQEDQLSEEAKACLPCPSLCLWRGPTLPGD